MSHCVLNISAGLSILFCFSACKEEPEPLPIAPPIISFRIIPAMPTLQVGEAVQFKATFTNVSTSKGFLWRTSDERVASVSGSGIVTGIGSGQAIISVKLVADTTLVGSTGVIVK